MSREVKAKVHGGRSPHGERGLKSATGTIPVSEESLSSWRAWIEIANDYLADYGFKSLSSWRAWIEMPV